MLSIYRGLLLTSLLFLSGRVFAAWEPTFVDNFWGNSLESEAWTSGGANLFRRSSYYHSDAVQVKDGKLELKAINQPEADRPYLSGRVSTQGIFAQKYGYFEMRAKVPAGDGYWPAFWLLPETGKWTSEIDISEFLGNRPASILYAYHHSNTLKNENSRHVPVFKPLSESFNTYAVNWSPDRIDYIFNGTVMHSITDSDAIAKSDTPMYVILNLALANGNTGFISNINRETNFNSKYIIDYVRVFKESATGQFTSIPAASTHVPNAFTPAYDNTAVTIDRVKSPDEKDILRFPDNTISGKFKLTSHKQNLNTKVIITLFKLQGYTHDGRYYNSPPIQSIIEKISLDQIGDSTEISYSFDQDINTVGAYAVDVLIKDPASLNKKSYGGHRIIQYVDDNTPVTTLFFDGFVEDVTSSVQNNTMNVSAVIQLQQALLTPYIDVKFTVLDANGTIAGAETVRHTLEYTGRLTVDAVIDGIQVNSTNYRVLVDVSEPGGLSLEQVVSGPGGGITPPPSEPLKYWQPTFVDNFNGNELKLQNWVPGRETLSRRISYYDKDAIQVTNGQLNIKMLNKAESDRPYTTAAITTQGLFKQKYGYFEMRAKTPKGNGFWPAFWLLPESGVWQSEIDISEFIGNEPDTVHYAYHYGGRLRNENTGQAHTGIDLSTAFNTFAVDWSPERIHYLFNGVVMHTVDDPAVIANADSAMFMILNLALASQHTGFIANVDETTDLSGQYEIDYIRVYEEAAPGSGFLGIPTASTAVPDMDAVAYDETAISVDRIKAANETDIMRTAGKVSGAIRLTSHAASTANVTISIAKIENANRANGRYFPSNAIQTISQNVAFTAAGETLDIPYEFDDVINATGAYVVSILVKDRSTLNKKILNGHRIVQFVEDSNPTSTLFFDGFVRSGSANYDNGQISTTVKLQLQQALLAPYINVHYLVINNATGDIVKTTDTTKIRHNKVGEITLSRTFDATLDPQKSYSVIPIISDSSGDYTIAEHGLLVTQGGTPPPPVSDEYELHTATVNASAQGDLTVTLETTLPDGASFSSIKYLVKLFSLEDNSLVTKLTGSVQSSFVDGRQLIVLSHDNQANLIPDEQYRAVVILFKNNWGASNKILTSVIQTSDPGSPPPPVSSDPELHGLAVNTSTQGELILDLDTTLPNGGSITSIFYNIKLFSLQDGSLLTKLTGEVQANLVDGRQSIEIIRNNTDNLGNDQYRAVVFLFKDGWSEQLLNERVETSN